MKHTNAINDVPVYNLSSGRTLPSWLTSRKRRKLTKLNPDIQQNIEVIQDFTMNALSSAINMTNDGQYILVTGTYAPRVKCFDTAALSLKFDRGLEDNVIKFLSLGPDYSKLIFLQENRYLEFHNRGGRLCRVRIPRFGRDLMFDYSSSDLYVASSGNDVYKMNMETGLFQKSLNTKSFGNNVCAFHSELQLACVGGENGVIELYDARTSKAVTALDCTPFMEDNGVAHRIFGVTALNFTGHLTMGVGTHTGQALLFDLRNRDPYLTKEHNDSSPIEKLLFHQSGNVLAMTKCAVHIWNDQTADIHTVIQSKDVILNDMCSVDDSGMILLARDDKQMGIHFVPSIGSAPKWCHHVGSLVEHLDADETGIYDDYKFVTREELESLYLEHLIGTDLLKASLHGFYINLRLYNKAKDYIHNGAPGAKMAEKTAKKIRDQEESALKIVPVKPTQEGIDVQKLDERFSRLSEKIMATDPEFVSKPMNEERKRMLEIEEKDHNEYVKQRDGLSSDDDQDDDAEKEETDQKSMSDSSAVDSEEEIPIPSEKRGIKRKALQFSSGKSVSEFKKDRIHDGNFTYEQILEKEPETTSKTATARKTGKIQSCKPKPKPILPNQFKRTARKLLRKM